MLLGHAKNCVQNDQCSCTFDDGSGTVDITRIGIVGGDPLYVIFLNSLFQLKTHNFPFKVSRPMPYSQE